MKKPRIGIEHAIPGLQDRFLLFVTLPTPRVDINQSQGRLRPSVTYSILFLQDWLIGAPFFHTHKSGSVGSPTVNTKRQQTACRYITPRLRVRARVNIAHAQSPGANSPALNNYLSIFVQKTVKIGLTYLDILP